MKNLKAKKTLKLQIQILQKKLAHIKFIMKKKFQTNYQLQKLNSSIKGL